MAFTERLKVIIDVATEGATKGLSNFRSAVGSADTLTGKLRAGTKSLGETFKSFITHPLGAATAVSAVSAAAFKAVNDFSKLAKESIDLGKAVGMSTEQASRWIAVGDDFGVSAESLASGIGKITKSLDSDKWAKYGISTRDASGNVRDANSIFLDALDVLGRTQSETERAKIGTDLLGKGWASIAPIVGKSRSEYEKMLGSVSDGQVITDKEAASGEKWRLAMDRLSDAFADLAVNAGESLAPALTTVVDVMAPLLEGFNKLPSELKVAATVAPLAAVGFTKGRDALQALNVSTETATTVMGGLVGVIGVAATAYGIYAGKKREATQRTKDFIEAMKLEGPEQESALDRLAKNDKTFREFLESLNEVGLKISDVEQFAAHGTGALADMLGTMTEPASLGGLDELAGRLGVSRDAMWDVFQTSQQLRSESLNLADTQDTLTQALKGPVDLEHQRARGMQDAADSAKKDTGATEELKQAIQDQATALQEANRKMTDQLELKRQLYGDARDEIERRRDYAKAERDAAAAIADTSKSVDDQMDSIISLAEQYGTLNGASLNSKEGNYREIESLQQLASTLDPNSPLRKALDAYIETLKLVPQQVDTQLKLHVKGAVFNKDGDIIGMTSGARALGGPVSKDSMYQVAEGGKPELLTDSAGRTFLIPGRDGVVSPIGGTGTTSAAGGNNTFNITITNPVVSGEQLANELKRYIARNGSAWLS